MATLTDLAPRVLQKLKVLAADEAPSAADREKALEKLKAAHYSFGVQSLAQWTMNDVPPYAEEPYVAMAAFLAADDFEAEAKDFWPAWAMTELQRAANIPALPTTYAVDY